MITAFPVRESECTAEAMLDMLLEKAHVDEGGMFSVPLEGWEIDLLSCYGAGEEDLEDVDLEDSDDDEDASLCG